MLQRNPQALDHHLSHESQLTGRGQHMPEEGHSDIAGIQSVASICTRSVIRPSLKYTAWPACPPEVSSRHLRNSQAWGINGAFDDDLAFFVSQKVLGPQLRSISEVTRK